MRGAWTMSAIEALIFVGVVLVMAGAGTWVSVVPSNAIDKAVSTRGVPMAAVAALH
jgi:hypothetical protein